MRILQVSSHYPPYHTGGAEHCCSRLSSALAQQGHAVRVAAPVASSTGEVEVVTLPVNRRRALQKLIFDYNSPAATAVVLAQAAAFAPDVVHVHNVYGIGSRLISAISQRVPTVVTLHDYWPIDIVSPRYERGVLRYPLRAAALRPWTALHRAWHARQLRGARLVAPSGFLADRVGGALGLDINVARNGVDMPADPGKRERRVLFVGRLVWQKGLSDVLPVIAACAAEHGWEVDIIGDGPLREPLSSRYPAVRFHGNTDPAPFYRKAGVLVVPSIWPENAPLVLLEGMAHGLCVVASASGGIPEVVRDGETGLLHRPGDRRGLARRLDEALGDETRREALGGRARAEMSEHAWERVTGAYLQQYELAARASYGRSEPHTGPAFRFAGPHLKISGNTPTDDSRRSA